MKLELVRRSDAPLCMEMMEDFYQIDNYPFSEVKAMKCFEELLNNDQLGRYWLINDDGNKPIGYIILCFGYSFEYGGKDAFIDEFYLVPEARGKGAGTKALKLLKSEAKKLGVKAIHLEVEKTNSVGNMLYLKVGYIGNDRSLLTQRLDQ